MKTCKYCRHPIIWGTVLDPGQPARRMPFNPIPTEHGTFVLGEKAPIYRRLGKGEKTSAWRYTPHNDTCKGDAR